MTSLREQLLRALSDAAELEHAITCQYLFAAFSIKTSIEDGRVDWPQLEQLRSWKASLLRLARQEMSHHGLVCNLLIALAGAPHYARKKFPHTTSYCPPYTEFELQPFSLPTLERFAAYERAHAVPKSDSAEAAPATTGGLYAHIKHLLTCASDANAWLFIGPLNFQLSNSDLRLKPGQFDIELATARDLTTACTLIDRVLEHDHLVEVENMQRELEDALRRDASFEPALPVVSNPCIDPNASRGPSTPVEHPLTRRAMVVFNGAYGLMNIMLMRLYGRSNETEREARGLIEIAVFAMMTAILRPLGEILTRMPVAVGNSSRATAGPNFDSSGDLSLPPFKRSAWMNLHERMQELARDCGQLALEVRESNEPWTELVGPSIDSVFKDLQRIAQNFERHMNLQPVYVQHMLGRIL